MCATLEEFYHVKILQTQIFFFPFITLAFLSFNIPEELGIVLESQGRILVNISDFSWLEVAW